MKSHFYNHIMSFKLGSLEFINLIIEEVKDMRVILKGRLQWDVYLSL